MSIWVSTILVLFLIDCITTYLGLRYNLASELNPGVEWFVSKFGLTKGLALSKVFPTLFLLIIPLYTFIYVIIAVALLWIVCNNLTILATEYFDVFKGSI